MIFKKYLFSRATAARSLQLCPTLCDPRDGSPPGSSVPGILQARTLEWVAISFSNAWKWKVKVKALGRVRLTLSDPMDCSLPGSSIHGIFQARVLEWGAIAFSIFSHSYLVFTKLSMMMKKLIICPYHLVGGNMSFVKQVFPVKYIGQAKDAVGPPFNCGTQRVEICWCYPLMNSGLI